MIYRNFRFGAVTPVTRCACSPGRIRPGGFGECTRVSWGHRRTRVQPRRGRRKI